MAGFHLRAAFATWAGMARELGALRVRLGALVGRVRGAALRAAWDAWVYVMDWQAWLAECNATALRKFMLTTGTELRCRLTCCTQRCMRTHQDCAESHAGVTVAHHLLRYTAFTPVSAGDL